MMLLLLTALFVFALVAVVMGIAYVVDADANRHDSSNSW
jgi:hypothetical protein